MKDLPKQAVLLLITSQDWGGAQLYVFELARELKLRGESVIVAAGTSVYRTSSIVQNTGNELSFKCREAGIDFLELEHTVRDINPI
ncbi:hypothetical protein GF391_01090, partial [Candidatus Uhrbacteria bacterium]|nr:hypothetical protein [Candidatus Uhrbacteria bacterium]